MNGHIHYNSQNSTSWYAGLFNLVFFLNEFVYFLFFSEILLVIEWCKNWVRGGQVISKEFLRFVMAFLEFYSWIFKPTFVQIWELFWKKFFFHPRVPPLCFEPFWTICPARFCKWQGSNLKIEISSFHFSSSFCYNKIACYLVFSNLKITPLSPPPN